MLSQDIHYALRQLRKSPGFTITAVLTLALGIGANTAIFTLMDSILLRRLPFPHQEMLMRIGSGPDASLFPKGWIRALAEHSASFAAVSGFGADAESNVEEGDASARYWRRGNGKRLPDLGNSPGAGKFLRAGRCDCRACSGRGSELRLLAATLR